MLKAMRPKPIAETQDTFIQPTPSQTYGFLCGALALRNSALFLYRQRPRIRSCDRAATATCVSKKHPTRCFTGLPPGLQALPWKVVELSLTEVTSNWFPQVCDCVQLSGALPLL
jgi:hypothetical protein